MPMCTTRGARAATSGLLLWFAACASAADGPGRGALDRDAASPGGGGAGGAVETSDGAADTPAAPDASGTAAADGSGRDARAGAAGGGAGAATGNCVEAPAPRPGDLSIVTFDVDLRLGGKPLVFKEWNDLPGGGRLMPTNLRLYLSEAGLRDGSGRTTAVDLVDAEGAVLPFNVHLLNAEDAASLKVRVRAPAGSYAGISFVFGIGEACNNTVNPRNPPLHEGSQMKWPHALGYLFLRFESKLEAGTGAAGTLPPQIHMGGFPPDRPARLVEAKGAFDVSSGPVAARLVLALDKVIEAAGKPAKLDDFVLPQPAPPGPIGAEVLAGEALRQNVTSAPIFTVEPAR